MSDSPTRLVLSDEQRFDWLRLLRSETIGPRTFRALVNRHGSARAVLEALPDLARRSGRSIRLATEAEVSSEMVALRRVGGKIVALGEPDYPRPLEAVDSAPPLISIRGKAALLSRPAVAIVGARNASALGQRFAATMARGLGEAGLVVTSGLARGVDGAAHEAALSTGTVAVLAGGLGRVYPREHEGLAERIAAEGVLMSEMPFGWTATGRDFPRRNRIVSGLSYGVVVVEAALRSGSLITARFAGEQGREVFAVPGSPLDPRAEGCNRLIREGATLVTAAADVIESLRPVIEAGSPRAAPLREDGGDEQQQLWDEWDDIVEAAPSAPPQDAPAQPTDHEALVALIGSAPVTVDELVRRSGFTLRQVQVGLMDLDLAGRLAHHGENRISLI